VLALVCGFRKRGIEKGGWGKKIVFHLYYANTPFAHAFLRYLPVCVALEKGGWEKGDGIKMVFHQ